MKKYIPIIASIALVAIVGCVYFFNVNKWDASLIDQKDLIDEYKNAISVQQQSVQDQQEGAIESVSGIDFSRVEKDNKTAETFLKTIMTWSSYEEYEAIRQKMINDYNLPKDGTFMTVFLPEIANKTSKDGKNYNKIDNNGLNMAYESMDSYVTKITSDTYSYFTVVTWSSSDNDGNEATSKAVFTYSIDSENGIAELEGYTIN